MLAKLFTDMMAGGQSQEIVPLRFTRPLFGSTPVTAYRFHSLMSPNKDGDDDYFSSDLPIEKLQTTFGAFPPSTPLLILCSGKDEWVPDTVDVEGLIKKWASLVKAGGGVVDEEESGIIKLASHNFRNCDKDVIDELCGRVIRFLMKAEDVQWRT
jgi:hypothetical protein